MAPMGNGKGPGRNRCQRMIGFIPTLTTFKPVGVPMVDLESVVLTHEELESMRLVDLLGLDHENASKKMGISRRSFATDLKSGRKKVLHALTEGMAIKIDGGDFRYKKEVDQEE
jgi:predicted DNA-binding protein (UPF0251 family)